MAIKYPAHIQKILDKWLKDLSALGEGSRITLLMIQQVESLVSQGDVSDISKIKTAVERGCKDEAINQ